jgi:hypothetical protein
MTTEKETAPESSLDSEAAVSETPISRRHCITDKSYVPTALLLLAREKTDLEKFIPEQPGLDWNGPLSLKLDAVNTALEVLRGAYGDGDE